MCRRLRQPGCGVDALDWGDTLKVTEATTDVAVGPGTSTRSTSAPSTICRSPSTARARIDRGAGAEKTEGDRRPPASRAAGFSASPPNAATRAANVVDRNGPLASARPISRNTSTSSARPQPTPPVMLGETQCEPSQLGGQRPRLCVDVRRVPDEPHAPAHGNGAGEELRGRRDDLVLLGRREEIHQRGNPSTRRR